jgi:hypothetical protein
VWRGTGSKTTKRGAEHRWRSTRRWGSRRTGRKGSEKKSAATGTSDLPFFRGRVYGARETNNPRNSACARSAVTALTFFLEFDVPSIGPVEE